MRLRLSAALLMAGLAAVLLSGPGAASATPRNVVQPHLPRLGKEPAIRDLMRFRHQLRARDYVSGRAVRKIRARKRQRTAAAQRTLEARDRKRRHHLKAYLAHHRRHHRQIKKTSSDYYAFLRSKEWHRARQILAQISDQIDRLETAHRSRTRGSRD